MKLGMQSSARNVHNAKLSAHRLACQAQHAKLCSQRLANKVQHANLSTQNSACGAQQSTYLKSTNCSCSPCWGHAGVIFRSEILVHNTHTPSDTQLSCPKIIIFGKKKRSRARSPGCLARAATDDYCAIIVMTVSLRCIFN